MKICVVLNVAFGMDFMYLCQDCRGKNYEQFFSYKSRHAKFQQVLRDFKTHDKLHTLALLACMPPMITLHFTNSSYTKDALKILKEPSSSLLLTMHNEIITKLQVPLIRLAAVSLCTMIDPWISWVFHPLWHIHAVTCGIFSQYKEAPQAYYETSRHWAHVYAGGKVRKNHKFNMNCGELPSFNQASSHTPIGKLVAFSSYLELWQSGISCFYHLTLLFLWRYSK